eukprot:TRINITY_DN7904_c0_g4_i1.p1 TRINITY_DN7904_c0_g4~~TRINITY_DN7904_c0_g4_i1.p1  ORF type:complete len:2082 (+),score=735.78 TRINITY_DN7904_c0_g4_i1:266-6247(+)
MPEPPAAASSSAEPPTPPPEEPSTDEDAPATPQRAASRYLRSQSLLHQDNVDIVASEALMSCFPRLLMHRLLASAEVAQSTTQVEAIILFIDVTGFTKIANVMQEQSAEGVDDLSRHLNGYFDLLVNIMHQHGGDILEFSGDAILGGWFFDLESSLLAALKCAQELANCRDPFAFTKDGVEYAMRVHIGAAVGPVMSHFVGGAGPVEYGLWHHLLTGACVEEACYASGLATAGEVALSEGFMAAASLCRNVKIDAAPCKNDAAYVLMKHASLPPEEKLKYQRKLSTHYLEAIRSTGTPQMMSVSDLNLTAEEARGSPCPGSTASGPSQLSSGPPICPVLDTVDVGDPEEPAGVTLLCGTGVRDRDEAEAFAMALPDSVKAGDALDYVKPRMAMFACNTLLHSLAAPQSNELRTISTVFLRLVYSLPGSGKMASLGRRFHQAVRSVQNLVARWGGVVNKILMDDKGIIMLCLFGVPRHTHENDTDRSVHFAMAAEKKLRHVIGRVAIGVTRARVFTGLFGNHKRREHTALGQGVNNAARLMQEAHNQLKASQSKGDDGKDGAGPWAGGVICDAETMRSYRASQYTFKELGQEKTGRFAMYGIAAVDGADVEKGAAARDPIRRLHASSTRSDLSSAASHRDLLSLVASPPAKSGGAGDKSGKASPKAVPSPRSSMLSLISRSTNSTFYLSVGGSTQDLLDTSLARSTTQLNPIIPSEYVRSDASGSPKLECGVSPSQAELVVLQSMSSFGDAAFFAADVPDEQQQALTGSGAARPLGGAEASPFKVFGMVREQQAIAAWAANARACSDLFRAAAGGNVQNGLILAGGPQSGKTVLLAKAQEWLVRYGVAALPFVGESTPTPFHTLAEVFRPLITEESLAAAAAAPEFASKYPDGNGVLSLLHLLARLPFLPPPSETLSALTFEQKVAHVAGLLVLLCRIWFKTHPFAFLVDDAHAIDPESWAFFHAALQARVPMLILFSSENYTSMDIMLDSGLQRGSIGTASEESDGTSLELSMLSGCAPPPPAAAKDLPAPIAVDDASPPLSPLPLPEAAAETGEHPPLPPAPPPPASDPRRKSSVRFLESGEPPARPVSASEAKLEKEKENAEKLEQGGPRWWRSLSHAGADADAKSLASSVDAKSVLQRVKKTPGTRSNGFRDMCVESERSVCHLVNPLAPHDVEAFMKHLLSCNEIEDVLLGFVLDKSAGIPGWVFMVTECLHSHRALVVHATKRAVLAFRDHYALRGLTATVPALQCTVLRRLDAFSPAASGVLQLAAAVAMVQPKFTVRFLLGCVHRVAKEKAEQAAAAQGKAGSPPRAGQPAATEATLRWVLAEGFFLSYAESAPNVLFFTYSIVQDVLYNALPQRERAHLHAVAAAEMRRSGGNRSAATLGLHLCLANDRSRATKYLAEGYQAALDMGDLLEVQQRLCWLSRCAAGEPSPPPTEGRTEKPAPSMAAQHVEKWALNATLCAYELGSVAQTEVDFVQIINGTGCSFPAETAVGCFACCGTGNRRRKSTSSGHGAQHLRLTSVHAAVVVFEIGMATGNVAGCRDAVEFLRTSPGYTHIAAAFAASLGWMDLQGETKAKPCDVSDVADTLVWANALFLRDAGPLETACNRLWDKWPRVRNQPHRLYPALSLDSSHINLDKRGAGKPEMKLPWPERPSVQAQLILLIGLRQVLVGDGQAAYATAVEMATMGDACFFPKMTMFGELLRGVTALVYTEEQCGFLVRPENGVEHDIRRHRDKSDASQYAHMGIVVKSPRLGPRAAFVDASAEASFRDGLDGRAFTDRGVWVRPDERDFLTALLATHPDLQLDETVRLLTAAVQLHHARAAPEATAFALLSTVCAGAALLTPAAAFALMLGFEAALLCYSDLPGGCPRWKKPLASLVAATKRAGALYPILQSMSEYVLGEYHRRGLKKPDAAKAHYTKAVLAGTPLYADKARGVVVRHYEVSRARLYSLTDQPVPQCGGSRLDEPASAQERQAVWVQYSEQRQRL